jgi:hypothetical protein
VHEVQNTFINNAVIYIMEQHPWGGATGMKSLEVVKLSISGTPTLPTLPNSSPLPGIGNSSVKVSRTSELEHKLLSSTSFTRSY